MHILWQMIDVYENKDKKSQIKHIKCTLQKERDSAEGKH